MSKWKILDVLVEAVMIKSKWCDPVELKSYSKCSHGHEDSALHACGGRSVLELSGQKEIEKMKGSKKEGGSRKGEWKLDCKVKNKELHRWSYKVRG